MVELCLDDRPLRFGIRNAEFGYVFEVPDLNRRSSSSPVAILVKIRSWMFVLCLLALLSSSEYWECFGVENGEKRDGFWVERSQSELRPFARF